MTRVSSSLRSLIGRTGLDVRRRSSTPFGVRWEDDVWRLSEGRDRPTVFDVGANRGQTANILVSRFPGAAIYSFEPVRETFNKLVRNTERFDGVQCFNIALGEAAGEGTITTDRRELNTLIPEVTTVGRSVVQISTVDNFCEEKGIERIDLLKIDTEGFEIPVLHGSANILSNGRIDFVLAECDFVRRQDQPHGNFFEIHDFLSVHDFSVVGFYVGGVDNNGWIWGDVLMARKGAALLDGWISSPFSKL